MGVVCNRVGKESEVRSEIACWVGSVHYGVVLEGFRFLGVSSGKIEGIWRRVGDQFAGCVVRVRVCEQETVGDLISVPDAMAKAGWNPGDLKWRKIEVGRSGGGLRDLRKYYDARKAEVLMVDYCDYHYMLDGSGKRLRIFKGASVFFPDQRWIRL